MSIDLEKLPPALQPCARTAQVSLSKHRLSGHRARVVLALDMSGSMRSLYASGRVQILAERVLALASRLDDDGAIEVIGFGTDAYYLGDLSLGSYAGGVGRLIAGRKLGRTNYADAIHLIRDRTGSGPLTAPDLPCFVLFLTDGAPTSRAAATLQLVAASAQPIFFQFMGVTATPEDANPNRFDYLRRLDTSVPGRVVDNAGFFAVDDLDDLTDDELYARMLSEYPDWLQVARAHAVLTG